MATDDEVRRQLSKARERLLDLTMRNRLLNFRPTKRTTIRVVDELPGQVWQLLVGKRKAMVFLSLDEGAGADSGGAQEPDESSDAEDSESISFDLPSIDTALAENGANLPERYTDLFLQTALPRETLQTNLLRYLPGRAVGD